MVSRREEDMEKRKGKVVFNEDSKSIKRLSADERKEIEKTVRHMGKLDEYYPVESGSQQAFLIDMKEFRESEVIRLKSVEQNIPLVLDTLAVALEYGLFDLIEGKKTTDEVVSYLTTFFEMAQKWIVVVGNDGIECSLPIMFVNKWVDDLVKFNEETHLADSEIVREILYCDCQMSLREHISMLVTTMADMLKVIEQKSNITDEEMNEIIDDSMKRNEHRSGKDGGQRS